ncbi:MFS transporter [Candidatus Hydrogenedentota bacterium]
MSDIRVSRGQRLAYSSFTFGHCMPSIMIQMVSLLYMTQVIGLDPLWLGVIQIVPTFWDAISDPLMGAISDRTRTRWGRRIPYVLTGGFSWVFLVAIGWMIPPIYVPWAEAHGHSLNWMYLIMLVNGVLNRTAYTVSHVPYAALGGELSDLPDERNKLAAARGMAAQLGKIVGMVIGKKAQEAFDITIYPYVIIGLCSFTVIGLLITCIWCKERYETTIKKKKTPSWRDMAKVFKFKPFLIFTIGLLLLMSGFVVSTGLIIFLGRFYLLDDGAIFTLNIGAFITTFLSLMYWPKIMKRIGNKNCQFIVICGMMVLFPLSYFIIQPYSGDPLFTGKAIESMPKRYMYKALTLTPTYTGLDIEDIQKLKTESKANPLVGNMYFSDMDPDNISDADFIAHLNDVISRPELYASIKDTPNFYQNSFKDYGSFAAKASDDASLISVFLEGRRVADSAADDSLARLNESLGQPLFFEKVKGHGDLTKKKLSGDIMRQEKKTIPARVKSTLVAFGLEGDGLDLGDAEFSEDQVETLAEIMHLTVPWQRQVKDALGLKLNAEKKADADHEQVINKLADKFGFHLEDSLTTKLARMLGKDIEKPIIVFQHTDFEMEQVAFLNRLLLEHAYEEELNKCMKLKIFTAKSKLVLMLVKTRDMREKGFSELSVGEQKDVRTTNRLLLRHLFDPPKKFSKKNAESVEKKIKINDAVPTLWLGAFWMFALLVGLFNGGMNLMPGTWIPDIADADEYETGFKRMGMFFGVETFWLKIERTAVPALKGFILVLIGLKSKVDLSATPEQLAEICHSLRLIYAAPVFFSCAIGMIVLAFYPLNSERLRVIRAELAIRRKAAEEENAE